MDRFEDLRKAMTPSSQVLLQLRDLYSKGELLEAQIPTDKYGGGRVAEFREDFTRWRVDVESELQTYPEQLKAFKRRYSGSTGMDLPETRLKKELVYRLKILDQIITNMGL
jgi:hypothetical protein